MPSATFRRAVTVGALTTAVTLSLIPQATADAGDEDVVRMKLAGVTKADSRDRHIAPGDSWTTYLNLYTPKHKFAGDASSRCTAVEADRKRLTALCTRVLRLKKGEITLHDMITREGDKPVTAKTSIAGGTGVYNDAEGEGYITLVGDRVLFDLYVDD
ncbi:hypothetical protein [Streptomyces sp. TRM68367]|uniref:hypothetical protein n=1 Tax=Streptomyces sp. TRM68367 TaxID=2758415 RepID=UPI00165A9C40|nr:hypothetical protein [Streptomyces sp. TRM68367]MBC9723695.1 hypothetical protein [Streptomyces sp. TRM68367]